MLRNMSLSNERPWHRLKLYAGGALAPDLRYSLAARQQFFNRIAVKAQRDRLGLANQEPPSLRENFDNKKAGTRLRRICIISEPWFHGSWQANDTVRQRTIG